MANSSVSFLKQAGQYLVYLFYRAVETTLRLFTPEFCWRIGYALGEIAWWLAPAYRRLAKRNIAIAFAQELSEKERLHLAREHFSLLGANILAGLRMTGLPMAEFEKRVEVTGQHHVQAAIREGRGFIFATLHMGYWELLTQIPDVLFPGLKPSAIYQPLGNPWLNRHILRQRARTNFTLFDRSDGFVGPARHLREHGMLGIVVDQHAGDHGVWCPLFRRLASTTTLPALMALRAKADILPNAVYSLGPARWRVVIGKPVRSPQPKPSAEELTAQLNLAIEALVRLAPQDWFWVHNRWKTPNPDFLLRHTRRGVHLPADFAPESLQPFEILIRSPNWLGDACMAIPTVRAFKQGRADAVVTIVTPAKLADIWRAMPEVSRVICREGKETSAQVASKIKQSAIPFDVAVLLPNSLRSAFEVWKAGIPRIVGWRGHWRARFLHQIIRPPKAIIGPPEHHALRYLRMARQCGADTDDKTIWTTGQIAPSPDGIIRIGLCPGAEYGPAKRWPADRFLAAARAVTESRPQVEWLLFGAPGETALGEQLSAGLGDVPHRNLMGKTTLPELIGALQQCQLLLTNDTGTMHLAAFIGVPTVSIFGSTEPSLTRPLGSQHTILRKHVPCSPCFLRTCPLDFRCMLSITSEEVAGAVLARISG